MCCLVASLPRCGAPLSLVVTHRFTVRGSGQGLGERLNVLMQARQANNLRSLSTIHGQVLEFNARFGSRTLFKYACTRVGVSVGVVVFRQRHSVRCLPSPLLTPPITPWLLLTCISVALSAPWAARGA